MKVTYLGTTTLLFDNGESQILFDCHVSRPSVKRCLFGKLGTDKEVADRVIRDFKIDRLRAVFVSHTHHDHVLDMPYFASVCGAEVYGSPSAINIARGADISGERLFSFADSLSYSVGGFEITVIPSRHSRPFFFNNDLGKTIDKPLALPARKSRFREGGSFDFLVRSGGKSCLIRPSCNFIEGQLDGIRADALFLGITGLSKESVVWQSKFFSETVDKVKPDTVIPIHWDNFFTPLYDGVKALPKPFEYTLDSLRLLEARCKAQFRILIPLKTLEL